MEANLYSNTLGIAGKVDAVCDYKGKKCVVDFKTSSRLKDEKDMLGYKLQVTAYALMWNELQGDNIQNGVIMMSAATGHKKVFEIKISEYEDMLKKVIKQYKDSY